MIRDRLDPGCDETRIPNLPAMLRRPPSATWLRQALLETIEREGAAVRITDVRAEQQITMSARAVEIATNNAQAEVAPLRELAITLTEIKKEGGSSCLTAYLRNSRIPLYAKAVRVVQTSQSS